MFCPYVGEKQIGDNYASVLPSMIKEPLASLPKEKMGVQVWEERIQWVFWSILALLFHEQSFRELIGVGIFLFF